MSTTGHETPIKVNTRSKGHLTMLLSEELARARCRELRARAAQARLARRLSVARRWRRLADWAQRHAVRAAGAV